MKKSSTLFTLAFAMMISLSGPAQILVAKWTFPTGNPADSLADGGLPANLSKAIRTEGGTSVIDFSKNGFTTKSAQATGWDGGAMTKSWTVEITTSGYKELKISSKQQSGGNNPGPEDFIVQYRIGAGGTWTDVPNTGIVTANNWTSGVLDSVPLPDSCANRASLFLRWLMTTNENTAGGTVASTGIDKIDDIYITGKQLSTGSHEAEKHPACKIYPNPAHDDFNIEAGEQITEISLLNAVGKCVLKQTLTQTNNSLVHTRSLPAGTYLLKVSFQSGKAKIGRIIFNQ